MARKRGRPPHDDRLAPAEWRVVNAVRFNVRNALGKLGLASRKELRHWSGAPADSPRARQESNMTAELRLGPLGQISRSVRDITESERWYRDTLGLPHLYTFGKLAFFDCGGTRLYLSQEYAAPGPESILYLKVTDIESVCKALKTRGVDRSR